MRQKSYPGSAITFEQTLAPGANYNQYIVSYRSDGYKIYALMTIPKGQKPATGWPVIIFNHGYIQPDQYVTTERYVAYVDAIARSGYIVFKSDYRGHGRSEGPTTVAPVIGLEDDVAAAGDGVHIGHVAFGGDVLVGLNIAVIEDDHRPASGRLRALGDGHQGVDLVTIGAVGDDILIVIGSRRQ